MRAILRSKQWNYTQKSKKNNKIRFYIFYEVERMNREEKLEILNTELQSKDALFIKERI
nr:MAG TPA: hypothetical protein [Caudoviricetes sp.]